jgi:MFS family permease
MSAPSAPAPRATSPGLAATIAVLLMASMTIMANATIAPSLPGLREHFADRPGIETLSGLLLTLPSLAILLTAGLAGWLADRFDRQVMLLVSGTLYALGGTSGLWAGSLEMMLAGRAVLGVGVAGTMTLAMTWGADLWQGPARAKFLGQQGAAMSAGGIVVMLLGGALAGMHWRGAFAVYLIVLPVMIVGLIVLAPFARRIRGEQRAAARAEVTGPAAAFPWRAYAFVGPLSFLFMATFYIVPTRLPFHMADLGLHNPAIVGMIMATMTLAAIPGSLLYGRIRRHLSAMSVFALSYAGMGLGMLIISQATGPLGILAGTLVCGAGMGPSMPNYTTYFMSVVPPAVRGRASGLLTTAFFAGQFASPLVSAPLVAWVGLAGAFEAVALILGLVAAALLALALREGRAQVAGA